MKGTKATSEALALDSLFEDLRRAKLQAGLLELQRAQELLSQHTPQGPEELRAWLRALLVKQPSQRAAFDNVFDNWVRRAERGVENGVGPRAGGTRSNQREARRVIEQTRPESVSKPRPQAQPEQRKRAVRIATGLSLLAMAALLIVPFVRPTTDPEERRPTVGNPQPSSVAGEDPGSTEPTSDGEPSRPTRRPVQTKVDVPRARVVSIIERTPGLPRAAWFFLAALSASLAWAVRYHFKQRTQQLLQLRPLQTLPLDQRAPHLPIAASGPQLLEQTQARRMVYGVEQVFADHTSRRLDTAATVDLTARRAGMVELRYQRPRCDPEVWLWVDVGPDDPSLDLFAAEIEASLQASGLPVRRGTFLGVPDRVRWLEGGASFQPMTLEAHRSTAIVAVLTDGVAWRRRLDSKDHGPRLAQLGRHLTTWPRLGLVDFGAESSEVPPLARRSGLQHLAPEDLPAFLGTAGASIPQAPSVPLADQALHTWAAALALHEGTWSRATAWALHRALDLPGTGLEIEALLRHARPVGLEFTFPDHGEEAATPKVSTLSGGTGEDSTWNRADLLTWFALAENHFHKPFRLLPGSRLERALEFWRERLQAERARQARGSIRAEAYQGSQRQRRLDLEEAFLLLWIDPDAVPRHLQGHAADFHDSITQHLERLAPEEACNSLGPGMIALPWRQGDIRDETWRWLTSRGFSRSLLEASKDQPLPPALSLVSTTLLSAAGVFFLGGALPEPPSDARPIAVDAADARRPAGAVLTFQPGPSGTYRAFSGSLAKLSDVDTTIEPGSVVTFAWQSQEEDSPRPWSRSPLGPEELSATLWLAGRSPHPPHRTASNAPTRSILWILAPDLEDTEEELQSGLANDSWSPWADLACSLLDCGAVDLALLTSNPMCLQVVPDGVGALADEQWIVIAAPSHRPGLTLDSLPALERKALVFPPEANALATRWPGLEAGKAPGVGEVWGEWIEQRDIYGEVVLDGSFGSLLPLVWVPSGKFRLGSPENEEGRLQREGPLEDVEVESLWVSEMEVTREDWRRVMDWEPTSWWLESEAEEEGRLPANEVSWLGATLLCNALSEAEGLKACYEYGEHVAEEGESWETIAESLLGDKQHREVLIQLNPGVVSGDLVEGLRLRVPPVLWNREADGYRLPTEAEWEYAARGGTGTRFPWGDDEERLDEYAWWDWEEKGNSKGRFHGVGELKANGFGLKDMIGNVEEWCWDAYDDEGYEVKGRDGNPLSERVLRGGCYADDGPSDLRPANRFHFSPAFGIITVGVRCVRSARRQP